MDDFTSMETARFMASLFTIDSEKQVLYALDAGAGSGYKKSYAENSRETFRKQAIHHFRNAAFIEDNGKSTNSPDYRYRLTEEFLAVIRGNGTAEVVSHFLSNHESLISVYASKKKFQKIPVTINGKDLSFSVGKHNELQKAIIEEFGARFAPGAECL